MEKAKRRAKELHEYRRVPYESLQMSVSNTILRVRRDVAFQLSQTNVSCGPDSCALASSTTWISKVVTVTEVTDYRHTPGMSGHLNSSIENVSGERTQDPYWQRI